MMSVLIAVLALGILIFVHELGHFIVAKKCGVKVERFSLGFGPALVSKTWGETEYVIAAVPLGGYVKMHGDVPEEWLEKEGLSVEDLGHGKKDEPHEPIDKTRSYLDKPVPQRIAIALAGPVFNLIFGYVAILAYLWVQPQAVSLIGGVEPGSPAAVAGLVAGDRITAVDGKPVRFFEEFDSLIASHKNGTVALEYERNGQKATATVSLESEMGVDEFGQPVSYGSIGVMIPTSADVEAVTPDSPAAVAGFEAGDRIVEIDGQPVRFWQQVSSRVKEAGESPIAIVVERKGERVSLSVTPKMNEVEMDGQTIKRPMIGIQGANLFAETEHRGFVYAFASAPSETMRLIILIPLGLYKLVVGEVPRDQIGGPIEIGVQIARAAEQGLGRFLFLLALISINLGILNLLPIPVLDGGHILFFLVEALNRKPVSLKTREIAQQIGLAALLLLMLFAFYNDIRRHGMSILQWFGS